MLPSTLLRHRQRALALSLRRPTVQLATARRFAATTSSSSEQKEEAVAAKPGALATWMKRGSNVIYFIRVPCVNFISITSHFVRQVTAQTGLTVTPLPPSTPAAALASLTTTLSQLGRPLQQPLGVWSTWLYNVAFLGSIFFIGQVVGQSLAYGPWHAKASKAVREGRVEEVLVQEGWEKTKIGHKAHGHFDEFDGGAHH